MTTPKPASAPQADKTCGCRRSDAWKCAVDKRLTTHITCQCECHRRAASAPPPDTLQAIVAEMRRLSAGFDNGEVLIEDWADRIEALAASAPPADALQDRVSEIEDAIAAGTMSAAQVFTQMRQLVTVSAQEQAEVLAVSLKNLAWPVMPIAASAQARDKYCRCEDCHEPGATLCTTCAEMRHTKPAAEPVPDGARVYVPITEPEVDEPFVDTEAEPVSATINSSEIDIKLIGEPAPVAQDIAEMLAHLSAMQHGPFKGYAILIRNTIADHARRDAALLADNERLRGAFDDHDEKASVHWYGEWVGAKRRADGLEVSLAAATETWTDEAGNTWSPPTAWAYAQACRAYHEAGARAEALEASLAACRANEARYLMLRNPPPKGDALCAWSTTESGVLSDRGKHDGPIDGDRLDAELDAAIARRQP